MGRRPHFHVLLSIRCHTVQGRQRRRLFCNGP